MTLPAKLTVCLDELGFGEDAVVGATTIGVKHVYIKSLWLSNVVETSDEACKRQLEHLKAADIDVTAILTRLSHGVKVKDHCAHLRRAGLVARYFKVKFLGIEVGHQGAHTDEEFAKLRRQWFELICEFAQRTGVTPLICGIHPKPPGLVELLETYRECRYLYDPATVAAAGGDPLSYWDRLKPYLGAVVARDYDHKLGFVSMGEGCGRFQEVRGELKKMPGLWYFVEPGLARGHRDRDKLNRLELALAAINAYLS